MKTLLFGAALVVAIALFTSCKKSNSSTTPPNNSTGTLIRIQQGTDPDITNDTVYNITYNDAKKISILVDSVNDKDSLVATYDANGNLTAVTDKGAYPINADLTYDNSNHLTQVQCEVFGELQQYKFDYTNGVVSKQSVYTDGSGSLKLEKSFTYTVTNGNITGITIFDGNGSQLGTATVTYSTQANPFANLSLFNYADRLGMDDLCPFEAYFNKDLSTGATVTGFPTTSLTNTFDSKQQLIKAVANDQVNGNLWTWQFYYK